MKGKRLLAGMSLASLVLASLTLFGCGGGGAGGTGQEIGGGTGGETGGGTGGSTSGGTGGGETGGTGGTQTYLFYLGSVYLVDPDNPTSPIQIPTKYIGDRNLLFLVSNFNSSDKSYTDFHIHEIYWIEEGDTSATGGGPLMKVSLVKGDTPPTPVQVSNRTDFCSTQSDPVGEKSYMFVRAAGNDGQCGTSDDEKYLVHSDMTSADNPIPLNSKDNITSIGDIFFNPNISGFLMHDIRTNAIQKCDTSLSNCTDVGSGTDIGYFGKDPNNGNIYLCVDNKLHVFDGNNLSRVTETGINCAPPSYAENDGQAIYALNSGNIQKFLYGDSKWTTIYNRGDASRITALTRNYVIFETTSDNYIINSFKAVSKSGDTLINIYTFTSSSSEGPRFRFSMSDKFFFDVVNTTDGTFKACIWTEGGSLNCDDNSYWAGVSYAVNGKIDPSVGRSKPAYKLLKVEGVSSSGGGTLYAVDPSNLDSKKSLGTVPENFILESSYNRGIGDNMLLFGYDLTNPQLDVFFVNLSQQNSLHRITNTPDKSEFPF